MSRVRLALVAVVLLSLRTGFLAQAPDVGPYTFNTMAYGVIVSPVDHPLGVAVDASGNVIVSGFAFAGTLKRISPAGDAITLIATVENPQGIALDSTGNIYAALRYINGVTRLSPEGEVTLLTGNLSMNAAQDVAVASDGTMYVAGGHQISRITSAGVYSVLAGSSAAGAGAADGTGTDARFSWPAGIAFAPDGTMIVADLGNRTIRRVTTGGVVTTLAGAAGVSGNVDGLGAAARFTAPAGVTVAVDGTIYVSDNHTIRRIDTSGDVTTLAGTAGLAGAINGSGSAARFSRPTDLATDTSGNVFVADTDNDLIRKVTPAGVVTTFVGVVPRTYTGANANLQAPQGVTLSSNGLLYVADTANHEIKRLTLDASRGSGSSFATVAGRRGVAGSADDPGTRFVTLSDVVTDAGGTTFVTDAARHAIHAISPTGDVSLYAGTPGTPGWRDGPRASALLDEPQGLALDGAGNLYVCERENRTVRKITPAGVVSTLAGMGGTSVGTPVDGTGLAATFKSPQALAVGPDGTIYVADGNHTIRAVTPAGVVTTLAGSPGTSGSTDGTGSSARFNNPTGIEADSSGNLFVVDSNNSTIRKVTSAGVVTTLAGTAGTRGHVDGTGSAALFWNPSGIGIDGGGNLLVSDNRGDLIRQITSGGVVTTLAGAVNGSVVPIVDGTGLSARFGTANGIFVRSDGTRVVADGAAVREMSSAAVVTTLAGGDNADGGSSRFSSPAAIASDAAGVLFVADTGNHTVRRVTSAGAVTTFAGTAGATGSANGTGAAARFSSPGGLIVGGTTVYVADTGNHTIRAITSAGVVTTLAGLAGTSGSTDATGADARFNGPRGIAIASNGDLFVADTANHVIRKITSTGVVTTVAGLAGTSGATDGSGSAARFLNPSGITVDAAGNLVVSDTGNHTLRAITPSGVVTTIGGAAAAAALVNGVSTEARFESPSGLTLSADGTLYVADTGNWAIRQGIVGTPSVPVITSHPADQTINQGQTATFTVGASANPGASYQWQYEERVGSGSFVAVTGAIHSSFSTSTLRSGRVRVVAGNAAGYTTSDWATLTVNALTASPSRINIGSRRTAIGQPIVAVTPAQTVTVTFAGTGTPSWTATSRAPWLQITGGSGTGSGSFTVVVSDPANALGHYSSASSAIDVTATNLGLTSTVSVFLSLTDGSEGFPTPQPIGNLDTPANNATNLSGTLAVTGWALDNIAMQRVEVWRNCVEAIDRARNVCRAPRPTDAANFVFVGNGTFVPGARPDLLTVGYYQGYPQVYSAGWGYLLLSNALPHIPNGTAQGGQGTFTLTAFAVDSDNNYTQLGAKTITLANDTATLPFGAIDTPEQGATIPGASAPYNDPAAYPVFGWAMTQAGKCIDTTAASNYRVIVNGVSLALTPGTNWFRGLNRADLAAAYPGLCNSTNALAAYYLDTRTLANGLHTIGWEVTDNAGQTAGIGSRFFTVLNSGSDGPVARDPLPASTVAHLVPAVTRAVRAAVGQATTAVAVRAEADGVYRLQLPLLGRIAIDLDGAVTRGYQRLGEELQPLPAGSTLDAATGRFYWQPPLGFLGTFGLVFVSDTERVELEITIVDPSAVAGDPEITIASPRAGANPNPVITVAGTARDPRALTGSGIDAVHVWAYRRDIAGVPPQFLGAATLNGDAYTLTTKPLQPGTYDLAVFAWVARTGTWAPAATVNIAVR